MSVRHSLSRLGHVLDPITKAEPSREAKLVRDFVPGAVKNVIVRDFSPTTRFSIRKQYIGWLFFVRKLAGRTIRVRISAIKWGLRREAEDQQLPFVDPFPPVKVPGVYASLALCEAERAADISDDVYLRDAEVEELWATSGFYFTHTRVIGRKRTMLSSSSPRSCLRAPPSFSAWGSWCARPTRHRAHILCASGRLNSTKESASSSSGQTTTRTSGVQPTFYALRVG